MKLLQLNAWMGRLDKAITNLVLEEQPDILNLQEVLSYTDGHAGMITTVEEWQAAWHFPYLFYSPLVSFNYMKSTAQFGNAILSRLPLTHTETIFTHNAYVDDFNFEDHSYNTRNLQHAIVNHDGKEVHVLNHHGYHVREHKNGTPKTDQHMQQIADYIDSLEGPVVLTGDFNLTPQSRSLQIINQKMHNLSLEYKLQTTRNRLTPKTEVCDYIFVNDTVQVQQLKKLDDVVSDHAALVLEFNI